WRSKLTLPLQWGGPTRETRRGGGDDARVVAEPPTPDPSPRFAGEARRNPARNGGVILLHPDPLPSEERGSYHNPTPYRRRPPCFSSFMPWTRRTRSRRAPNITARTASISTRRRSTASR